MIWRLLWHFFKCCKEPHIYSLFRSGGRVLTIGFDKAFFLQKDVFEQTRMTWIRKCNPCVATSFSVMTLFLSRCFLMYVKTRIWGRILKKYFWHKFSSPTCCSHFFATHQIIMFLRTARKIRQLQSLEQSHGKFDPNTTSAIASR